MNLSAIPIAALPLAPAVALPASSAAPAPDPSVPLERRLRLNPTITAKVNYFDLAQTRRPPFDLRSALIWLCLCAHDNSVWWSPRPPEHRDGEDPPPLPLALDFAAWMRYIQDWQTANFDPSEQDAIEALALRVWIGAHETVCVPEETGTKKNGNPPPPTGPSSTPTFSEETPVAGTTSSSPCPSAPSMPSSTDGSSATGSPASAPENPPGGTERSTISSPPPVNEVFWVAELKADVAEVMSVGRSRPAYSNGHTDQCGYDGVTTDIHAARRFDLKEQVLEWIRTRRTPEAWEARDHMIC